MDGFVSDLDRADDAKDERRERPNRAQLMLDAKKLRASLGQFLDDVRYFNRQGAGAADGQSLFVPSVLWEAQGELREWLNVMDDRATLEQHGRAAIERAVERNRSAT